MIIYEKSLIRTEHAIDTSSPSLETYSRYEFVARDAIISSITALIIWGVIVGMAAVNSHTWSFPLAIILGLAVLPFGLSGAIKRRV